MIKRFVKLFQAKVCGWHIGGTSQISREDVAEKVQYSVRKYGKTLKMLDQYDRGQIEKPDRLARHKSVQDYLRDLQRTASPGGGFRTSS